MTLKRFTVLFSSFLLLFPLYKIVQACVDGGDYEGESTFFDNAINAKPAFQPFYYIDGPKYYDDAWFHTSEPLKDPNLDEWSGYTANTVPRADLDTFIYHIPSSDLKAIYTTAEKGTPLTINGTWAGNGFTKWLIQKKDLEALGYLLYAKQCEPFATSSNEWTMPTVDSSRMIRLVKNGLQLHAAAKTTLIKDKFGFQAIRMAFYNYKNAQAIQLYDQLIGERTATGYTSLRCLSMKAGALYRQKKKVEAAYLYTQVFDGSDYLKKTAFLSFDWCVGQDATPVLKLCKTPHERAVVYLMDGLHEYGDGLTAMNAAYNADPTIAGLDVLMTREINKLEQRFLRPELFAERNLAVPLYYNQAIANASLDRKAKLTEQLSRLNTFAQKTGSEKKVAHVPFWQLSSSYLFFMQRDMAGCKRMMDAAKSGRMGNQEEDMYHTLGILYAVRNSGSMNAGLEAQILPDLQRLRMRKEQLPFRYAMNTVLTTAYLKGGDTVKAVYTLGLGSRYSAPDFTDDAGSVLEQTSILKLKEIQAFAAKPNKTAFEHLLTDSSIYTLPMLYELEGTKYLRTHEFQKAVAALEKGDQKAELPQPFTMRISEKKIWPEDYSINLMTKLDFAKRMMDLEKSISQNPDNPEVLMEYASGLYNMTYYGNAYHAFTYYRSSSDPKAYFASAERTKLSQAEQEYYGAMKAEATFVKAALHAKDKEQQAKALFMAAKCWQKRCPGTGEFAYYNDKQLKAYTANSLKNPYFLQLRTAAANTRFYEEAIGTCGYLADYATRK